MTYQLATRFARSAHQISGREALDNEALFRHVPSIFASEPHDSRSERYVYVPTIDIVEQLRREGWFPFFAVQAVPRDGDCHGHAKHMLRMRRDDGMDKPEAAEVIIVNSHDGTSAYPMFAGMLRFVCTNSMIAGERFEEVRVSHTRRKMLAGTAIAMGAWGSGAFAFDMVTGKVSSDPVPTLWRQWQDAHHLTERLCHRQQGLERQLIGTVGFPFSVIRLSDGEPLAAYSREAIHDVLRLAPEEAAACAEAEAEFEAHKLRWDRTDRDIGCSATVEAERDSADRASDLLDAMAAMPATSLAGVAAKLEAVLREGNIWEDGSESPWPQIRSALDDRA